MLVVITLVRRLNLEETGVILGDTVTALAREVTFQNPWMAAVLPGPARGRRADCQCHRGGTGRERCGVRTTSPTSLKKKGTITASRWNEYHIC